MKIGRISAKTILKTLSDIFLEVIISIVFLGLGALLIPILYQIFTTADQWVVVTLVIAICVGLSIFMAKVFE